MSSLRYRSAPERRSFLLELVAEQGYCSITELVDTLGVSDMTVRRDAQKLANQGHVRIVHGGVSVLPSSDLEGSGDYTVRAPRMAAAKVAIGEAAAGRLPAGETVGLDSGTTVLEVARALPDEADITAITQSAPVIQQLLTRYGTRVIALGGELHHETQSFAGASTLAALADLSIGTLFLAATGISSRGAFCGNDFDSVTKRALIDVSERVVLVADSSKFESHAMVRVCDLDVIDQIVVDEEITDPHLEILAKHDIDVVTVPVDASGS